MTGIAQQSNPLRPSSIPEKQYEQAVLDWAGLAIQEGQAFIGAQSGLDKVDDIIKAIMGNIYEDKLRPSSISQLNLNHMGKVALDLASSLTDIKPFFTFKTTNSKFDLQADMGNKLSSHWWTSRLIDLKFCDVIKYCLAAGSGYAHLVYDQDLQDMTLIAEDPRDVLPIRPTDMISVQNCFGVVIRRERTVNYLRHMYPGKAGRIHADRDGSYAAIQKQTTAAKLVESLGLRSGFLSNLYASLGGRPSAQLQTVPTADVFTIYVKDDSLNMTGADVVMGEYGWMYTVKPGEPLYPRKRCIILTRSCVLYDNTNIYWHGQFPIPKLTLDPWPWSWLGKAPMRDLLPIQRTLDRMAKGVEDIFEKYFRPDLVTDKQTMSKAAADRIDTRRAGLRLRTNIGQNSKVLQYPEMAGLAPAMEFMVKLVDEMKELSGTQELASLANLGQIPSSETIERMIESMSPSIRLRSRVMEAFLREVAMITLSNFFQFYTKPQRIAILGKRGLSFEDFDFDPDTLIPDMLSMGLMDNSGSPLPRYERAREFLRFFTYEIAPGSLLAASEVTDKLMYLQLSRMGIVDYFTLLEKLGIPNIGIPDDAGTTIVDRLKWQMQNMPGMSVGPAGASAAGRKSSAQSSPRMVVKES